MKPILTFLCLIFLGLSGMETFAQSKADVTGLVVDSASKPLPSSTVVLLDAKDSTLLKFTITDPAGAFTLKGVAPGPYIMQISYMGYKSTARNIEVKEGETVHELGNLILQEDKYILGTTTIEGQRIPILFKEDTIEYNANSFKPKANDAVEKLLKKLPGVEVDEDGTVKAQGQEVRKVLVDGKEFFGDDPKLATKNLPADAIDKVQVYDKMSDVAEFTGVDDGERQKVINLMLKEGRKKGYFGNATAGAGTYERYESKLSLNRFTKKTQLSFIGMANNTNDQGFSTRDYINFMGGLGNLMRGGGRRSFRSSDVPVGQGIGNGFINTGAGGLNVFNKFGKDTELNLSYFYNGIGNVTDRFTTRESFADNDTYKSREDASSEQRSGNHRVSMKLKHDIDSTADILVRGSLKYNDGRSESDAITQNRSAEGFLTSTSSTDNNSNGTGLNADATFTHRKKLKKDGRTLVTDLSYSISDNNSRGTLLSYNGFLVDTIFQTWMYDTLWQNQRTIGEQQRYGGKILYTEPLGSRRYLQFTAAHQRKTDESVKHFYDLQDEPYYQEILNPQLSNAFNSSYFYNTAGANYMVNRDNYNVTIGIDGQYSFLKGEVVDNGATVSKEFRNILPSANMTYRYNNSKRLTLRYQTRLNEPSVDQLQPVTDNSDPLNIYVGNPDLKAEYAQTVSLHYMAFSQFNFTSFFAYMQFAHTANKITNAVTVDKFLRQTTHPLNIDNHFNTTGYLSYGAPLKFIKTKVNLSGNLMYTKSKQYINSEQDDLDRIVNSYDLSFENLKKGVLDAKIGARWSQNLSFYAQNKNFNQNFLTTRYYAGLDVDFLKTWRFDTDFGYTIYSGDAFASDQALPIWKAQVSKKFLKDKKGELKVGVMDILNRNTGITRTSDINYIEEQTIETLGRYGMVSFTYTFRSIGKGRNKEKGSAAEDEKQ